MAAESDAPSENTQSQLSEEELRVAIEDILETADLSSFSMKDMRGKLEAHFKLAPEILTTEPNKSLMKRLVQEGVDKKAGGPPAPAAASSAGTSSSSTAKPARKAKSEGGTKLAQRKLMTRKHFMDKAKDVHIEVYGKKVKIPKKQFSTNSVGWYANTKVTVEVDGRELVVQAGLNLTYVQI